MRVLPYGSNALLVECDDADQVAALHADLSRRRATDEFPDFVDLVPAERTILIDGLEDPGALADLIARLRPSRSAAIEGPLVEITVDYDGPDLAEAARLWGRSVRSAVEAHCGFEYRVAFCGFVPGFAYLTGLPAAYQLPRRSTPRTAVPAGSVAIAGPYTGIYPRSSPGGWLLLGRTDASLWDPGRPEPALLVPGCRVRFVPRSLG
jgi:KipI family sensor histidine kinase inhibitor